jgi:hypothetical protein
MNTELPFITGFGMCALAVPPPLLDAASTKEDGLAFIGLSLSRHSASLCHGGTQQSARENARSETRQCQIDFDLLQDRQYRYVCSTSDDGWLAGGGEGERGHKIPAPDSAHCGKSMSVCTTCLQVFH